MTMPKLEVLLFSFEKDTGSREDCSVFYCQPLVVLATESDRAFIEDIIESHISFSNNDGYYDDDFDKNELLQKILDANFSASWQDITVYCNEE